MTRRSSAATFVFVFLASIIALASPARAQSSAPAPDPAPAQASGGEQSQPAPAAAAPSTDDPAMLDPIEPDFSVVNLPTTLRLPRNGGNFHLTHRFNENLRQDDFSTIVQNLFGIDTGANIGLEFRWGVWRNLEAIVQRTSISRDIQFSGKYDAMHQNDTHPLSISGIVAVEGDNNFRVHYSPALGVVLSRKIGTAAAVYVEPFWVHNTTPEGTDVQDTGFVGIGGRVRVLKTTYLIGEVSPRLGGYVIRDPEYAFGIEKRVGAHVFSLTFTNNPGTTFRQLALGGNPDTLNFGFNLTRKFF